MTAALAASCRLLNSKLVARAIDPRDAAASSLIETLHQSAVSAPGVPRVPQSQSSPKAFGPYGERARQKRVYDRATSRRRKRAMGGDGRLPNTIRHWFTEGERAVLSVIASEVKRKGSCCLKIEAIASKAGVSIRLTQYTIATASWKAVDVLNKPKDQRPPLLILVEYRPRQGAKSMPNVIKIVSREWINWLSYQPSEAPAVEAAEEGSWSTFDAYAGRLRSVVGIGCRKKHTSWKPFIGEVVEGPKVTEVADGWQRLRHGLPLQSAYERERAGPLSHPDQGVRRG